MPTCGKKKSTVTLELCWWEQTRLALEEVFRKARLTGTFPFTSGYNILLWPSAAMAIICIICSIIGLCYSKYVKLDIIAFNILLIRSVRSILTTINNILLPLWMIHNRKSLSKLLRSIYFVEKELNKASLEWKWKRNYLSFFMIPSMAGVIAIIQCLWLYKDNDFFTALSFIFVTFSAFPSMSYMWQYLTLHEVLVSIMIRISELEDSDFFVNCYHSLVVAYRAIDKLYGVQIIIFFIMAMFSSLHSLHFAFSKDKFDFMIVCQILWACYYATIILLIIKRCSSSITQSKMVNEQLYKRMVYEDNNNLIHDKLLAFHLSSCRKLVFTACGFFNLDNSLICSMVACATTYLVIMLQFTLPTNLQANNQSFAHF
ncbi:Gustatory receptor 120b [Halyomorpha halys]|nr:Gustatory receptor 120b [Halyomorpha halys]